MSFILDALRKSEHERQQQGATEFATVPAASGPTRAPRWLWVVVALLAINLAVLAGLLLRPQNQIEPVSTPLSAIPETLPERTAATATLADQVAAARREIPRQPDIAAGDAPATDSPSLLPDNVVAQDADDIDLTDLYSTYQEVVASGTLNVAPLHLDIHVYSDTPADRFVFINMNKHREGSRLDEGPLVAEIRPDGVLLQHRGIDFVLTRD